MSVSEPEANRLEVLFLNERDELGLTHIIYKCLAISESFLEFFAEFLLLVSPAVNSGTRDAGFLAGNLDDGNFPQVLEEVFLGVFIFHMRFALMPNIFSKRSMMV